MESRSLQDLQERYSQRHRCGLHIIYLPLVLFLFSQLYAVISEADDRQEVQEYAELVGPAVSSRMLLFRSG